MLRRSRTVNVTTQRVVKFLPALPPSRGETILVDGDRCRVTRCKVRWREPGVWEIRKLRVKRIGRGGPAGCVSGRGWPLAVSPFAEPQMERLDLGVDWLGRVRNEE